MVKITVWSLLRTNSSSLLTLLTMATCAIIPCNIREHKNNNSGKCKGKATIIHHGIETSFSLKWLVPRLAKDGEEGVGRKGWVGDTDKTVFDYNERACCRWIILLDQRILVGFVLLWQANKVQVFNEFFFLFTVERGRLWGFVWQEYLIYGVDFYLDTEKCITLKVKHSKVKSPSA